MIGKEKLNQNNKKKIMRQGTYELVTLFRRKQEISILS